MGGTDSANKRQQMGSTNARRRNEGVRYLETPIQLAVSRGSWRMRLPTEHYRLLHRPIYEMNLPGEDAKIGWGYRNIYATLKFWTGSSTVRETNLKHGER